MAANQIVELSPRRVTFKPSNLTSAYLDRKSNMKDFGPVELSLLKLFKIVRKVFERDRPDFVWVNKPLAQEKLEFDAMVNSLFTGGFDWCKIGLAFSHILLLFRFKNVSVLELDSWASELEIRVRPWVNSQPTGWHGLVRFIALTNFEM